MMKKTASTVIMALILTGCATVTNREAPNMPMKGMVKAIKADQDGLVSIQQVMEMERERISGKMKEMGMQSDKMAPAEWEKLYDQLYRGL